MSNQIVITSGAKLRDLDDVIIGTDGILSSVAFNVANGVPRLDENGKILVSQLPNSVMEFKGVWNAATNTPTLVNGTGNAGDVWLCNEAGTVDFGDGPIYFAVGDYAVYTGTEWARSSGATGTVTSVGVSRDGNALAITGSPVTSAGTINLGFSGDNTQYINGAGNLTTFPTVINSIGLTMPAAFGVSNSPLVANGTIGVTALGFPSQYIRGDGTLADFPTSGGGGSSVSYYLNGGTSQGTIGGTTYYEMSKTADTGTMADFSKTGDGLITAFLTDAGDPSLLQIPAGNWNYEIYASMSANGGVPELYAELYVYNGTTFTLISTSSNEILYDGTNLNLYSFAMTVPETVLTVTDRLAIKLYATNSGGKTTTVHTQDSHLCQVITTFTTGLTALNGLTSQVQYFGTGTSGSDFNIVSSVDTHTFNIPSASATARGLITTGTQTIAGAKTFTGGVTFNSSLTTTSNITFSNSGYFLTLQPPTLSVNRTVTLPNGTGTLALTSDISYPVTSVFGRTGAVVATSGDYTTAQVTESGNLYFTDYRARTAISATGPLVWATSVGTMSIDKADGFLSGYLSATDFNIFNGKQNAITLTTTGTSGAATLIGATLNIPNYADQYVGTVTSVGLSAPTGFSVSGSPVTSSGTLALAFASGYSLPTNVKQSNWDDAYTWVAAFPTQTGNNGKFLTTDGSSLSWAANPLGTVTSVAMSVPTGLTVSGSPITTSGTLAVTLTAGYSIPTTASQTNWDTAYTNRITSLTVTGSNGSATLLSNVLNIPTYTLAGLNGQPLDTNLTSLSGLTYASTSFVKMTAAGTFALDSNTYTVNPTLSGSNIDMPIVVQSSGVLYYSSNFINPSTNVMSLGGALYGTFASFLNSGWAASSTTANRYINASLGGTADFIQAVILLHPIYDTTVINYNLCSGKIYQTRGSTLAGSIYNTYDINTQSAYNGTYGSLESLNNVGQLVTCTYGGVKYLALLPYYYTSAVSFTFDGFIKSSNSTSLLIVEYRNSNTETILNSEVNSSIVPYSTNMSKTFTNSISASSLIKTGGTSSQFLKADGSIDSNTYYLASNPSGFITSSGSITGSAMSLGGYGNGSIYTILNGPTNGPVWKLRYDSATTNRYIDFGFQDGLGVYSQGLKLYNGDKLSFLGSTLLGTDTSTNHKLTVYNATEAAQVRVAGSAPSVVFTDTVTDPATYVAYFGMATAANNFIAGSIAGDYIFHSYSGGNILFGISNSLKLKIETSGAAIFSGPYVSFNGNGYIRNDATGWLSLQDGTNGFRVRNNTNTTDYLSIAEATGDATFSGNIGWGGITPTGNAGVSYTLESVQGAQIAARQAVPQLYISSNVSGTPYSPTRKVAGYAAQLSLDAFGGTMSLNRAITSTAGSAITWISNLGFDNTGVATFYANVTAPAFVNTSQIAMLLNNSAANNDFRMGNSSSQFRIVNASNTLALLTIENGGDSTFSGATRVNGGISTIYNPSEARLNFNTEPDGEQTTGWLISDTSNITLGAVGSTLLQSYTTTTLSVLDFRNFANNTANSFGGNVFIGTSVAQGINIGAGLSLGGWTTSTGSTCTFARLVGRKENATSGNQAGYLSFETSNASPNQTSEKARITSTGNFLIGTQTDDGYKLNVNGTAYVGQLRIGDVYSAAWTTDASWSSSQIVVPNGILTSLATYIIEFDWNFNGIGGAPYLSSAAGLVRTNAYVNSAGDNNEVALATSSHVGGNYTIYMAMRAASGSTQAGVSARLSWTPAGSGGTLTVRVKRIN